MKKIRKYEAIPYGFAMREGSDCHIDHSWEFFVSLPVMLWYKRHVYDISWDEFRDGRHTLRVMFVVGKGWGNSYWDFRFAAQWVYDGHKDDALA